MVTIRFLFSGVIFGGGLFAILFVREVEEEKKQENDTKIETIVGNTNHALG